MNKGVYFVSGIDTDCGKTVATALFAKYLAAAGHSVITQKFIQTGCTTMSEDIEAHRRIMGTGLLPEDLDGTTCPIIFTYPASPHLAARIDGRQIDLSLVEASSRKLSQRYDIVLLEGAGGLHVPIEGLYTTIDYVAEHRLPLIFVTSGRLGSINHTFLSLEACRSRGVKVHTLIYNHFPAGEGIIEADTLEVIKAYMAKYHADTEIFEIPVSDEVVRPAKLAHAALWTDDLDRSRGFYETYFGGHSGEKYVNAAKGFASYMVSFGGGADLEIMRRGDVSEASEPTPRIGLAHIAFSVGTCREVDRLTEKLRSDGYTIVGEPRTTGDGFYEAAVEDPDGNIVEIVAE